MKTQLSGSWLKVIAILSMTIDHIAYYYGVNNPYVYELMRLDPLVSVKLMWCFIQLLSNRLRVSTSELQAARNAFSCLKRGETVELPPQEAFLMTPLISPQKETDELIPGFLFSDMSGYKTEQLVHEKDPIDATNDLDSRPCSMVSLDFASIEK